MTATTPSPLGVHKDHHPVTNYQFTVFTWDAQLFHSVCKTLGIEYQSIENDEYPYYSIFKFTCDAAWLVFLTQRYISAGLPFSLTNFNLKD